MNAKLFLFGLSSLLMMCPVAQLEAQCHRCLPLTPSWGHHQAASPCCQCSHCGCPVVTQDPCGIPYFTPQPSNCVVPGYPSPSIAIPQLIPVTGVRYEERTRQVQVTYQRSESRTRTVPVTRYRQEVRQRVLPDGTLQDYTVSVPYTEQVTQEYMVQVPYTEFKTENYLVPVPYTEGYIDPVTGSYSPVAKTTYGSSPSVEPPADPPEGRQSLDGQIDLTLSDVDAIKAVIIQKCTQAIRSFYPDAEVDSTNTIDALIVTMRTADKDCEFTFSDINSATGSYSLSWSSPNMTDAEKSRLAGEIGRRLGTYNVAASGLPLSPSIERQWTSEDGRTVVGVVHGFDGQFVNFERSSDSKTFRSPIDLFSETDQRIIRGFSREFDDLANRNQTSSVAKVF